MSDYQIVEIFTSIFCCGLDFKKWAKENRD